MGLLIRLLIPAAALLIISQLNVGIHVSGIPAALVAALVLGIVNAIVRPIITLLTLPITVLTLGLFLLVINGVTFWLTSLLVPGFTVNGLGAGIVGAVLMWAIGMAANWFIKN